MSPVVTRGLAQRNTLEDPELMRTLAEQAAEELADAAAVQPGIGVVFLDTGYHFAETIGTRDAVEAVYPIKLINITPSRTVKEQDAALGPRLFGRKLRGLKTTAEELPNYVERVLRRFEAGREPGESFAAWTARAAEEDLEPQGAADGEWHCRSCTRSFQLRFAGIGVTQ